MGYYYPNEVSSRAELIEHLTRPSPNFACTGKYCSGNVLYTLWEQTEENEIAPVIGIDLMTCYRKDGISEWGYKPLDESMGPYYYACPLKYLDAAPVKNEEWREGVRRYWKARGEKRKAKNAEKRAAKEAAARFAEAREKRKETAASKLWL